LAFWLFLTSVNDTGDKLYTVDDRGLLLLQNYLQPPKSAMAANIVIGTAMKMHHRRPLPNSAAGDIADLSTSTFSYPWQLPTSLTPVINNNPRIFEKIQNGSIGILGGLGDTDS
jgi:hypothetical protein